MATILTVDLRTAAPEKMGMVPVMAGAVMMAMEEERVMGMGMVMVAEMVMAVVTAVVTAVAAVAAMAPSNQMNWPPADALGYQQGSPLC